MDRSVESKRIMATNKEQFKDRLVLLECPPLEQPCRDKSDKRTKRGSSCPGRASVDVDREVGRAHRLGHISAMSPNEAADICRGEGNELCRRWKYRAAAARYSAGIALTPLDYRLWNNRAVCFAALKEWQKCMADALRVTQLEPQSTKGWFLFAEALWKDGSASEAKDVLADALQVIPGNLELMGLDSEIDRWEFSSASSRTSSPSNASFAAFARPPKMPSRPCSPASASTNSPMSSLPSSRNSSPSPSCSAHSGQPQELPPSPSSGSIVGAPRRLSRTTSCVGLGDSTNSHRSRSSSSSSRTSRGSGAVHSASLAAVLHGPCRRTASLRLLA